MVDDFLWEPGDPLLLTDLVFIVEFYISEDAITPKIREIRVL
jgi:hypothetical protein